MRLCTWKKRLPRSRWKSSLRNRVSNISGRRGTGSTPAMVMSGCRDTGRNETKTNTGSTAAGSIHQEAGSGFRDTGRDDPLVHPSCKIFPDSALSKKSSGRALFFYAPGRFFLENDCMVVFPGQDSHCRFQRTFTHNRKCFNNLMKSVAFDAPRDYF